MACGGCGNRKNEVAMPQGVPSPQEPTGETTQCQCQFPDGQETIFCERHQCIKTRPLQHLCKYREDYFQLWESGHGPMQDAQAAIFPQSQSVQRPQPQPQPKQTTGFFKEENTKDAGSSGPQGLGDTIAKITEATGIKAVVDAVSEATGRDCGCQERQNKLNEMFPYKQQKKTKGFFQ